MLATTLSRDSLVVPVRMHVGNGRRDDEQTNVLGVGAMDRQGTELTSKTNPTKIRILVAVAVVLPWRMQAMLFELASVFTVSFLLSLGPGPSAFFVTSLPLVFQKCLRMVRLRACL